MKYFVYATAAALAIGVSSCNNNGGVSGGLEDLEGKNKVDSMSYALGVSIGQNFVDMELSEVNYDLFVQGIRDQVDTAGVRAIELQEAEEYLSGEFRRRYEEKAKKLKEPAENFMKENAMKEGVVPTETGVQYKVITQGTGIKPAFGDTVLVNYVGTLPDGVEFDRSADEPAKFVLSPRMMRGWNEGLSQMPEGSKYMLYIPWDLGYGDQGNGQIPPYSPLIFEVELVQVIKGKAAAPVQPMMK